MFFQNKAFSGTFYFMNSFKLFELKRKLGVFCPVKGFFSFHSRATEGKKDKKWAKSNIFLANWKSLNEFHNFRIVVKKYLTFLNYLSYPKFILQALIINYYGHASL